MSQTFSHRLGLAIRLLDTTTGIPVRSAAATLRKDGEIIRPLAKGDGMIVFLEGNEARTDFELGIEITGFEPKTVMVKFSELDKTLPQLDINLLPGDGYQSRFPCHRLDGELSGITEVDTVRANDSPCLIREWDARKKLLTIFNPHRLNLDRTLYALVDPDREVYKVFSIVKRISDQVFKIDRPLEMEFKNYFPICPVILGAVGPGDNYLLRVPDDSSHPKWIVRKVCGEVVTFETVDPTAKPPPDDETGGDE